MSVRSHVSAKSAPCVEPRVVNTESDTYRRRDQLAARSRSHRNHAALRAGQARDQCWVSSVPSLYFGGATAGLSRDHVGIRSNIAPNPIGVSHGLCCDTFGISSGVYLCTFGISSGLYLLHIRNQLGIQSGSPRGRCGTAGTAWDPR